MWQEGKRIVGVWTNNQEQDAWVYVDGGLGWRKISIESGTQWLGMLDVCMAAYVKNSPVNFDEIGVGGDIYIAQIYSW